ncbi:MAG: signal peptidase I [Oscillospiraceae bacterium]
MNENNLDTIQAKQEPESAAPRKSEVYDWIQCVVVALLFCVLLFSFFTRLVDVIGSSMYPTLEDRDKIVISKLFYTPKQGDIIVFRKDSFKDEPLVKRIIATEGQTVDIDFQKGIVYVDGKALDEPYIAELTLEPLNFNGQITVPEGCIFVMGDNRMHSTDSRDNRIGCVDTRCIMGKVYFTVYPLKNFGSVYK